MEHTTSRLPVYAHWHGQEIVVDLPENQPEPGVGTVIHLTINVAGELQRRPFRVTAKRQRTDTERSGLLTRWGIGNDGLPIAVDLDVELHRPEH